MTPPAFDLSRLTPPAFDELFKSLAFIHVGFVNLRARLCFFPYSIVAAAKRLSSHARDLETRSLAQLNGVPEAAVWRFREYSVGHATQD